MLDLKRPRSELDKQFLLVFSTLSLLFVAYFWKLDRLTTGLSQLEANSRAASHSLSSILNHPLNAPYSFLQFILHKVGLNALFYNRLLSALLALLFLICFYKIARHWFGKFIALNAAIIFAMTPLVILVARSASPDIMFLLPLGVGSLYFWYTRMEKPTWWAYLILIFVTALSLYTPGLVWLLIIGLVSIKTDLLSFFRQYTLRVNAAAALVALLTIIPLVFGLFKHPELINSWLLIPGSVPHISVLKDLLWSVFSLGWQSPGHSIFQIDKLALLSATQMILAVFGGYALYSRARTKLFEILGILALGVVSFALSGNYTALLLALVATGILAAAGLRYLYIEWQGVFPKNPLPRSLALILIFFVTVSSINYGIRYSLVAWPHTISTKSAYVLK